MYDCRQRSFFDTAHIDISGLCIALEISSCRRIDQTLRLTRVSCPSDTQSSLSADIHHSLRIVANNGIHAIIKQFADRDLRIHSPRDNLHTQAMCSIHNILCRKRDVIRCVDSGITGVASAMVRRKNRCANGMGRCYPVPGESVEVNATEPWVDAVLEPGVGHVGLIGHNCCFV